MMVEKLVKVKLTSEEEEILGKANDIINEIYNITCQCDCEIEYENEVDCLLDEMQATIRQTI